MLQVTHGQDFTTPDYTSQMMAAFLLALLRQSGPALGFPEIQKYLQFSPYIFSHDLKDYLLSHKYNV